MATKPDHPSGAAYAAAAWLIDCEVAAIRAFAITEAGREGAFLDDGAPVILFERHKFHKATGGRFAGARAPGMPKEHSRLSSPERGGYGPVSAQHEKLKAATALDRAAALASCSWGLFQILGENYLEAGFSSLQDFINAHFSDVDWHLRAWVMYVRNRARGRLARAVREKDWQTIETLYNGPAAGGVYARKMERNYTGLAGAI